MMKAASFTMKQKVGKFMGSGKDENSINGMFAKSASQLGFGTSQDDDSKKKTANSSPSPSRRSQAGDEAQTSRPKRKLERPDDFDAEFFVFVPMWEKAIRLGQVLSALVAFSLVMGFFSSLPSSYYKGYIPSLFYLTAVFSFLFSIALFSYHMTPLEIKEKNFGDIPISFKQSFTVGGDALLMMFWFASATQASMWCRACFSDLETYIMPLASRSSCGVFASGAAFAYLTAVLYTITTVFIGSMAYRSVRVFCGYDRDDGTDADQAPRAVPGTRSHRRSLFTIPGRDEDLTHKFSRKPAGTAVAAAGGGAASGRSRSGSAARGGAALSVAIPEEAHVGGGGILGARASVTGGKAIPFFRHNAAHPLTTAVCRQHLSASKALPVDSPVRRLTAMTKKENVWDYPRPPAIEPTSRRLRVELDGVVIADTTRAFRILETSHPPTYYIPLADVKTEYLVSNSRQTFCEWKGSARYYDVKVGTHHIPSRVWYYPSPSSRYAQIKDHVSFYASPFKCFVDGEEVIAQPGDFYGGWMTSDIDVGYWVFFNPLDMNTDPFSIPKMKGGAKGVKGGPGTMFY
ncbi:hypothetical protein HDU96_004774 [Phlyctochytrium bullatum]|nr:hypothetical protein HDU96_004774 [Phlyctochytrium bullatum]